MIELAALGALGGFSAGVTYVATVATCKALSRRLRARRGTSLPHLTSSGRVYPIRPSSIWATCPSPGCTQECARYHGVPYRFANLNGGTRA